MMQGILNPKNLVAFVLAAATRMTLYFRVPFPKGNIFLRVMALRPWQQALWQQAYTYLVKFIILLHKVAFAYESPSCPRYDCDSQTE
jgi:hypothetical protein